MTVLIKKGVRNGSCNNMYLLLDVIGNGELYKVRRIEYRMHFTYEPDRFEELFTRLEAR